MACLILCRSNKIHRVKTDQRPRLTRLVLKPTPSRLILGSCFWQCPPLCPDDRQKLASAGPGAPSTPPCSHDNPQQCSWGWPLLAAAWPSHPHCCQAGPPGTQVMRQVSAHVTCRETEAQSNSPESPSTLSPDLWPHWAGRRALPPDLRLLKSLSLCSSSQPIPLP